MLNGLTGVKGISICPYIFSPAGCFENVEVFTDIGRCHRFLWSNDSALVFNHGTPSETIPESESRPCDDELGRLLAEAH